MRMMICPNTAAFIILPAGDSPLRPSAAGHGHYSGEMFIVVQPVHHHLYDDHGAVDDKPEIRCAQNSSGYRLHEQVHP